MEAYVLRMDNLMRKKLPNSLIFNLGEWCRTTLWPRNKVLHRENLASTDTPLFKKIEKDCNLEKKMVVIYGSRILNFVAKRSDKMRNDAVHSMKNLFECKFELSCRVHGRLFWINSCRLDLNVLFFFGGDSVDV